MSEEFETLNSKVPNLDYLMAQRIASQKTGTPISPSNTQFDPYQALLKKKEAGTDIDTSQIQKWPEEDVKKLQDYCSKMGIVGFNSGKMHPIAALSMLKQKFGEDFSGVPLENRIPRGYEKIGEHSKYGPNYPYSEAINKKVILHD